MDKKKFQLKLNLFDTVILAVALCAVLILGYMMLKPAPQQQEDGPVVNTVEYVVRFNKMIEGAGALIQPGDELVDTIKNYNLGTVVGVEILPCQVPVIDNENKKTVNAVVEGYEDVLVTVRGTGSMSESCFVLDGGYNLRVDTITYVKGNGYMGSGPVVSIVREVE